MQSSSTHHPQTRRADTGVRPLQWIVAFIVMAALYILVLGWTGQILHGTP